MSLADWTYYKYGASNLGIDVDTHENLSAQGGGTSQMRLYCPPTGGTNGFTGYRYTGPEGSAFPRIVSSISCCMKRPTDKLGYTGVGWTPNPWSGSPLQADMDYYLVGTNYATTGGTTTLAVGRQYNASTSVLWSTGQNPGSSYFWPKNVYNDWIQYEACLAIDGRYYNYTYPANGCVYTYFYARYNNGSVFVDPYDTENPDYNWTGWYTLWDGYPWSTYPGNHGYDHGVYPVIGHFGGGGYGGCTAYFNNVTVRYGDVLEGGLPL